jgi:polyhydroxyalkanoate synthesis repressor PhaR
MSQPIRPEGEAAPAPAAPVVVKKYANRRLYNTESSSYITLDNLAQMVRAGRDFVVYDAKTGEDITRSVLTQIIVEEESKGRAMLPTSFLRQLIGFYGDSLQTLVPRYLEQTMSAFARQQEQMRLAMRQSMGMFPFSMEEVGRQNLALMERAMSLFAPFYRAPGGAPESGPEKDRGAASQELAQLRAEVESLRRQLAEAKRMPAPEPTVPVASAAAVPMPKAAKSGELGGEAERSATKA